MMVAPAAVSTPPPTRDTFANGNTFEPHPDLSTSFDMPVSGSDPPAGVTASHHSNAQSPQPIQSQSNTDMTAHAQALHHSLLHVSGTVTPAVVAPTLARVIPSEGPKSGGIEVTILGEGFHSGLDVLFADAVATQTTVFNSGTMICLIPPSFQAGLVRVSLRGRHQPDPQVWFRYNDTDEEDLMRLALAVFHHRNTGKVANASDIARSIIGGQPSQNSQPFINGNQHPQNSAIRRMELELSILGVIDLIDQTDSVIAPRYSICRPNGQTMLHLSASLGYHRLVAGLLARGVNPDLRDRNGMSAMHMACLQGHAKVVRKLLSAGGDPTLRSLLGLAPIDMATTREVHQLTSTNAHHTRPSSVAATPVSHHSRASSVASIHSMWGTQIGRHTPIGDSNMPYSDALVEAYRSRPVTPADVWARSRRNSTSDKKPFVSGQIPDDPTANTHLVAAAAAMAAWRENLAGQIQHFQQSVQRTLPNLQMPNLPPLPNFEGYQELPMVRRISSLVPRMNPPAAPPAYEEIYPESTGHDSVVKKASVARAIGDALVDEQCAANFDRPEASFQPSIGTMTEASTKDQPEELRLARGRKVKKLSNDRKLFFVWVCCYTPV